MDGGSPAAFDHDAAGNLVVERTRTGTARTYAYDAANRLTEIDDPTGNDAVLAYDPLGRIATRTVGSDVQTISDALRTDAYGQTIGLYPATGSDLPVRFRGLFDLAPTADRDVAGAGSDPLYAMGARPYSPHLGTFTALDSYAGAQFAASLGMNLLRVLKSRRRGWGYAYRRPVGVFVIPIGALVA